MLKKGLCSVILAPLVTTVALADTIQLKDKATVTGTILAEKHDQVVVDIGYTVLTIPRKEIVRMSRSSSSSSRNAVAAPPQQPEPEPQVAKPAPTPISPENSTSTPAPASNTIVNRPEASPGIYSAPGKPMPIRSVRDLVNQVGEAVVQVRTPSGLGSGFFINEDGFLMTNFHVIEGETQISVEVYHQRNGMLNRVSYKNVRIIAMNKFEDLALLKIEDKDAPKFKFVLMGNSDAMSVGERVFAVGSPLGLERTVTEGILSTKTRQLGGELYLQTTTQINPGNSGGPLFNLAGEVVGVTNMKITFGEGLGFAIPVEAVKFFLDHRDSFAYSNDNPSNPYRYLEPPSRIHHSVPEDHVE
jgi:serine protease Do